MSLNINNFSYATFLSSMDNRGSTGSGFRIKDKGKEFLVTARHVLFNEKNELRSDSFYCTSQNSLGEPEEERAIVIDLSASNIIETKSIDIVSLELVSGKNYEVQQEGKNIIAANIEDLLSLNDIIVSAPVIQVGFPTSLYLKELQFFDINWPLLRKGIIAGIHKKGNTFIIGSPAFYGNSGGPVILPSENGNTKVIGIVSRYVPFMVEWKNKYERKFTRKEFYNSGYTICVPLDSIIENISELKMRIPR